MSIFVLFSEALCISTNCSWARVILVRISTDKLYYFGHHKHGRMIPKRTLKTSLELSEVGVRVLKIPVTHEQKGLQQFSTVLESCGRRGLASVTLHSSELARGLSTQAWEWGWPTRSAPSLRAPITRMALTTQVQNLLSFLRHQLSKVWTGLVLCLGKGHRTQSHQTCHISVAHWKQVESHPHLRLLLCHLLGESSTDNYLTVEPSQES